MEIIWPDFEPILQFLRSKRGLFSGIHGESEKPYWAYWPKEDSPRTQETAISFESLQRPMESILGPKRRYSG